MAETQATNAPTKKGGIPRSIPYIIGNEAAERFNYYGLRAILTTFMIAQFYNPTGDPLMEQTAAATANSKTHDFVAMSYLLPMFGGLVADWFWGKYKTILYLSLVYVVGNISLALSVNNEAIFTTALMLIAIGAGGIKPCVSANVGDQFDETNQHLISKAFDWFYLSINAGSLLSILLIPYLKNHYGPTIAFAVPAIAMLTAVAFFYAGRDKYRKMPAPKPDANKRTILMTAFGSLVASYIIFDKILHMNTGYILGGWAIMVLILAFVFKKAWFAKPGNFVGISLYAMSNGGFNAAAKEYGDESVDGIKAVWRVMAVFAFIPIFWALWDQSQSEWVVQAQKMDLNWLGIKWEAEQISFVNAAFILFFVPLFSYGIFPLVEKLGIKVTPMRKIGVGFVLTALSFVMIAIIQQWIDAGQTPNISWQIYAFVILTAAEVLISITCLEYAYTQAPPAMKSTIMACYLLTVTIGNVIVSVIQSNIANKGFFAQFEGAKFFWLFVGICSVTAVLFMFISPFLKEKSYFVSAPE
jgi:proton-dependent oligopeptide transporter, POT family